MEEFRVPKEKIAVIIDLPPHPPQPRYIFLSAFALHHQGAETPSDVFGVPQVFVPLYRESGEVVLARRDAIVWVMVSEPRRTEWLYFEERTDAPDAAVHIEFDTGSHLEGRIALIGPVGARRVLDVVNRPEGFLHVERDDELFLVNPTRVTSIILKEE